MLIVQSPIVIILPMDIYQRVVQSPIVLLSCLVFVMDIVQSPITKLLKGIPHNVFFKYYTFFKFSLCFACHAWGASMRPPS